MQEIFSNFKILLSDTPVSYTYSYVIRININVEMRSPIIMMLWRQSFQLATTLVAWSETQYATSITTALCLKFYSIQASNSMYDVELIQIKILCAISWYAVHILVANILILSQSLIFSYDPVN